MCLLAVSSSKAKLWICGTNEKDGANGLHSHLTASEEAGCNFETEAGEIARWACARRPLLRLGWHQDRLNESLAYGEKTRQHGAGEKAAEAAEKGSEGCRQHGSDDSHSRFSFQHVLQHCLEDLPII